MCYVTRTRYKCTHLSPFQLLTYRYLDAADDAIQADPQTAWPTHPHTIIQGCQDACHRGARCSGRLEDLEIVEKKSESACGKCEEKEIETESDWVVVEHEQ